MGIGLVAHVENQFVLGGIEHRMQGHNQVHRTQAGTQMAGIHGAALHHILPDIGAKLLPLFR